MNEMPRFEMKKTIRRSEDTATESDPIPWVISGVVIIVVAAMALLMQAPK